MPEWVDAVKNALIERFSYVVNEIWGHVIYRPVEKAKWKIPAGMRTLDEFMEWHRRLKLEQKRTDHPLALECYVRFTTKKPLTKREKTLAISVLAKKLVDKWFAPELVEKYIEWGYEKEVVEKPEPFESEIRYSRDGKEFKVIDVEKEVKEEIGIEYEE